MMHHHQVLTITTGGWFGAGFTPDIPYSKKPKQEGPGDSHGDGSGPMMPGFASSSDPSAGIQNNEQPPTGIGIVDRATEAPNGMDPGMPGDGLLIYVDKHVRPGDFQGVRDGDVSLSVSTPPIFKESVS